MKSGKTIAFWGTWLVVIIALSFILKPGRSTSCVAQDGSLLVTGKSGYSLTIVYGDLTSVELCQDFNYGERIDGVDDKSEKSGAWQSDALGTYQLCVNPKVRPVILLRTADSVMVINFESKDSTQALYEAILKQIKQY